MSRSMLGDTTTWKTKWASLDSRRQENSRQTVAPPTAGLGTAVTIQDSTSHHPILRRHQIQRCLIRQGAPDIGDRPLQTYRSGS